MDCCWTQALLPSSRKIGRRGDRPRRDHDILVLLTKHRRADWPPGGHNAAVSTIASVSWRCRLPAIHLKQGRKKLFSISNCGAACLMGFALSGCMQSASIGDVVAKPGIDAFSRLGSWQVWRETPVPMSAPGVAEVPPQQPMPIAVIEPKRVSATERQLQERRRTAAKPQLASRPVPIPMPAAPEASPIPANVTCRTSNVPGERVRMQCFPTEAGR